MSNKTNDLQKLSLASLKDIAIDALENFKAEIDDMIDEINNDEMIDIFSNVGEIAHNIVVDGGELEGTSDYYTLEHVLERYNDLLDEGEE